MNQEPIEPTRIKKFDLRLIELDAEEKIVCEIRKHKVGLILTILTGGLIALVVLIASGAASVYLSERSELAGQSASLVALLVFLIGIIVAVLVLGMTYVGTYIYQHNVMLVTTDKIAQVLYRTIFDRKISQLSINDVQDVTILQKGMFARLFDYGTITIETAGEQENYTFTYAPHPYACSKDIISAREFNVKKYGN